jgi:hypothetical protein
MISFTMGATLGKRYPVPDTKLMKIPNMKDIHRLQENILESIPYFFPVGVVQYFLLKNLPPI